MDRAPATEMGSGRVTQGPARALHRQRVAAPGPAALAERFPPMPAHRRLMRAPDRPTTTRWSMFVPLCAVRAAWLVALGLLVGCLNPMPDDFPSEREDD